MDNKKLYWTINGVLVAGLIILAVLQFKKQDKIAYIDNNMLMSKYQGMKDMRAEYEKKAAVYKANTDTLIAQWQQELKDYERMRSGMSAKERDLKEELLNNKQMQISQYQDAINAKANDEEHSMTQTVLNDINDYIQAYGKKHGYTYILGATGNGNLMYAVKSKDITEDVLQGLEAEYKKK